MTDEADLATPPRIRVGVFVLVALLHLLAVLALIRAFAPDFAWRAIDTVVSTFAVEAPHPVPSPSPSPAAPPSAAAARPAGDAGAAGRRAVPRAVSAPRPRIAVPREQVAPLVAGAGSADTAGARDTGAGTGGGPAGSGSGSGGSGSGQGGGGGSPPVKIAGDINSARDYPAATRDLRIGGQVVIALTVGPDGRPGACRVVRPSRDAEADAITCRLAQARFRFRPATDAGGQPVSATYGWQQRWFYRGAE